MSKQGWGTVLKDMWEIAVESIAHPASTTYYGQDGKVSHRVSDADDWRAALTIAKETVLHPFSRSYLDTDGSLLRRENLKGQVTYQK